MIERNKSDHKFAHVMAAQLPWHVQNYGLIGSLFFMSEQNYSISAKWKHKSSVHIGFIVFNGGVTTFFAKSVWMIICVAGLLEVGAFWSPLRYRDFIDIIMKISQ